MIRVIESVQGYLKFLKEHLADCAAAAVETSHSVAQISATLPEVLRVVREIHDQQGELTARLNSYLDDSAKEKGSLERFKSEVRKRLDMAG